MTWSAKEWTGTWPSPTAEVARLDHTPGGACAGRFGHPSQHQASAPCYDLDHLCHVMSELASHKEPDDPASPVCVPIQGRV